jgi:hypothetical protein
VQERAREKKIWRKKNFSLETIAGSKQTWLVLTTNTIS